MKVLLVEDNPGDARLLREMLQETEDSSFQIEHVDRLDAGLEALQPGEVDLVLLDLSLPDSSGIETFQAVRKAAPWVPLIVMSGLSDEDLAIRTVKEGAQDYLVKGHADSLLLTRAMHYAVERKRTEDQLERYAAELREKNEVMEQDLRMAREIQQSFLPRQYPTFPYGVAPDASALEFVHRWIPTTTLGGDFFDVLALSDTAAGVMICDVMGHGVRSALVTAMMRALVGERADLANDPAAFLGSLNAQLLRMLDNAHTTMFASAFYMVMDLAKRELRFASAGHQPPLVWQGDEPTVAPLQCPEKQCGPALGIMAGIEYQTVTEELSLGQSFVLYTDGLFEVASDDDEEYGEHRVQEFIQQNFHRPMPHIFDGLLQDASNFSGTTDFDDDVCLLGAQVNQFP